MAVERGRRLRTRAALGLLVTLATLVACQKPAERGDGPPGGLAEPLQRSSAAPGGAFEGIEHRAHASPGAPRQAKHVPAVPAQEEVSAEPSSESSVPAAGSLPTQSSLAVPSSLPAGISVGRWLEMPVPADRNLRVSHAPGALRHALVYLHGMCGAPKGADGWVDLANRHGTFVVVRADQKCPDRPGYKWPSEVSLIHERIQSALTRVKDARGGLLDTSPVTLIGYSQGAHRAERLAEAYPADYRVLILGGPPTAAEPVRLSRAERVAVLGGELEDHEYMQAGALALRDAGIPARFFLLPGAHHGSYGPRGREVLTEVFAWLYPERSAP